MNDFSSLFTQAEQQYGLPPGILTRLARVESRFNPKAYNPESGAAGLFQFIPDTARAYGIDPYDPVQATQAAAHMYAENLNRFGGSQPAAVAAHFAGPDIKLWGPKTEQYVNDVLGPPDEQASAAPFVLGTSFMGDEEIPPESQPEPGLLAVAKQGLADTKQSLATGLGVLTGNEEMAADAVSAPRGERLNPAQLQAFKDTLIKEGEDVGREVDAGNYGAATLQALDVFTSALWETVTNPSGAAYALAEQAGNLLATYAPGLVLGKAGAVGGGLLGGAPGAAAGGIGGFVAGAALGEFAIEAGAKLNEMIAERAIDPSNREAVLAVLRDPKVMQELRGAAGKRGLAIAAADAVANALGAKLIMGATGVKSAIGRGAAGVGLQSLAGGGGELAGEYEATGNLPWGEAGMEAGLEAVTGPFDIAATAHGMRNRNAGTPAAQPTAETVPQQPPVLALPKPAIDFYGQAGGPSLTPEEYRNAPTGVGGAGIDQPVQKPAGDALDDALQRAREYRVLGQGPLQSPAVPPGMPPGLTLEPRLTRPRHGPRTPLSASGDVLAQPGTPARPASRSELETLRYQTIKNYGARTDAERAFLADYERRNPVQRPSIISPATRPARTPVTVSQPPVNISHPPQVAPTEISATPVVARQTLPDEQQTPAQSQPTAPAPLPAVAPQQSAGIAATGKQTRLSTARGTQVEARFALVDANALTASHDAEGRANPAFPGSLQPRDRTRGASQVQIAQIAGKIRPELLGDTGQAASGAPIVGPDGVVESGNGRVAALRRAYAEGRGEEYRNWLATNAQGFGIDPAQLQQLAEPVLVRVRTTELDEAGRAAFAREANQADIAAMSAAEQARADAGRIDDDMMGLFQPAESGDVLAASNARFLKAFADRIGNLEAGGLVDANNRWSRQMAERVRAAVFAKAYGSDDLIQLMAEDADPDVKNILSALMAAAPEFAKARALDPTLADGKLDIVTPIVEGVRLVRQVRAEGGTVDERVRQRGLFGDIDQNAARMALFFDKNSRANRRMSEGLQEMAQFLASEIRKRQNESLLPVDTGIPDIITAANRRLEDRYGKEATVSQADIFESGRKNIPADGAETARNRSEGGEQTGRERTTAGTAGLQADEVTPKSTPTKKPWTAPLRAQADKLDVPAKAASKADQNAPRYSRRANTTAYTEDAQAQVEWLNTKAVERGSKNIDDLATKEPDEFKHLAEEWRKDHPIHTSERSRISPGTTPQGISADEAQAIADQFQAEYTGTEDLEVVVVGTQEAAFGPAARDLGRIKGGWLDKRGAVVLVAENLDGARDVRATLLHEFAAHYGLRKLVGDERLNTILDELTAAKDRTPALRQLFDEVAKDYPDVSERVLAEEVIARAAEDHVRLPMLRRVWAQIIKALRAAGLWRGPMRLADVDALVMDSMRHLRNPRGADGRFVARDEAMYRRENAEDVVETAKATRAQGLLSRVYELIDRIAPLGTLPSQAEYLKSRYLALGRIAKIDETARGIYDAFATASEQDRKNVYDFLTNRGASPSIIQDPAVRESAVRVKSQIMEVGKRLVDKGLLAPETFEANQGQYLPRIYLKHLLDESSFIQLGTGKKPSDLGYLKQRKDIPEDVRRLILGEITDPGYLASKGYGLQMRDVALLDWLDEISKNKQWVLPRSMVDWRGKRVTPFWLKSEANRIRAQAIYYTDTDKAEARAMADSMDETADAALGDNVAGAVPDGYKRMPDSPRYGAMRGLVVRAEIYDDIVGALKIDTGDASVAERVLGDGGAISKLTSLWKWAKVAANPPAQARNFISNAVLLHLSGVPFHRVPQRVIHAIREMRTDGEHWQVAKKYGVTASTFSAQELYRIERELLDLEARHAGKWSIATAKSWAGYVMDKTSDLYQLSEGVFKTAKIIDAMQRQKMSASDAAMEAQKWLFDYSLVQPSVRYLRNAPVGAPFVTFYTKALPRMLEVAINSPWRFAPYVAIPYVLTEMIASMANVDDDDVDALQKALPDWLQKRGHAYFLPVKDDHGRWQAIDMGYWFPWTTWTELAKQAGTGEVGDALTTSGLLGGPLPDLIAAVKTNTDPFTQREIVNKEDTPARQAASLMNYLWRLSAPTWLTDIGFAGHLHRALTHAVDRKGEPRSTETQAMLRLVGANLYPIEPLRSRAENIERRKQEISRIKARRTYLTRDRNLTMQQRREIYMEYGDMIREKQKSLLEYRKESRVHPNLQ